MPQLATTRFVVSAASKYVGIDTLQEQTRIRALKEGFCFNLLVAGRGGLGKSTMVNTLFKSQVVRNSVGESSRLPSTTEIRSSSCILREGGVQLKLTITDTPGFGDQINNENCWDPLINHIEDQYALYLENEIKVDRPKIMNDTRIHCCLYFISPSGHELTSLDVEVLKRLERIVNVIPVIAKADSLTLEERFSFKERIRSTFNEHGIRIFPYKEFEDDEDAAENEVIRERMPLAVIGSTNWNEIHGRNVLGRKTNWGMIEVENKEHSDFPILRDLLIRTHMKDLIDITNYHHYESYRKCQLTKQSRNTVEQGVFIRQQSTNETDLF